MLFIGIDSPWCNFCTTANDSGRLDIKNEQLHKNTENMPLTRY